MKKKILTMILVLATVVSVVGCGKGSQGGAVSVDFMYGGDVAICEMYKVLIEEFNNTVGAEKGITIKGIPKTTGTGPILLQQLPTDSAPDVCVIHDANFKKCSDYLVDLEPHVDKKVVDDFYSPLSSRYRYNAKTATSNSDDTLYGLPSYSNTTVLFYNRSVMEKLGVICISVAEDELADFNAGKADGNGKTKADYGIEVEVPAKGFYRSVAPFVPGEGETNGDSWTEPLDDEVLIFNDRIAMNWDEIEDLGMLCTQEKNPSSPSKYGYYTEWWFNYGWSVGGDCIEDLSGKGDWVYTLAGENPNYIVREGKTYTGKYTGTVYNAGDTLDLKDILDAKEGDTISYKTDEKTYFEYTINGNTAATRDFSKEIADGVLWELPSIKEGFSRFCYLAGEGGLNISPYPSAFNGTGSTVYFTSGTLAMLVEQISGFDTIEKTMTDDWSVAPLPKYKEYTNPADPSCDTIKKEGATAAHSDGYCIAVSAKSTVQKQAIEFLNWMSTEGQRLMAEKGYMSLRKSDAELSVKNSQYENAQVALDCLAVGKAGDWWYMPDRNWIDTWATPLNNKVRYGTMSLDSFLYGYIEGTNDRLAEYKN